MRRMLLGTTVATLLVVVQLSPAASVAAAGSTAHATVRISTKAMLAQLSVRPEHTAGYSRSAFKLWDSQGNGCNTRDVVLIDEATRKPHVSSSCALSRGKWLSLYDGVTTTEPSTFDIDHLVPLAEAWQSGAWSWSAKTREAYANDLGYAPDLVAVSAHANRSKGDDEPSAYLPPRSSFDCTYEAWWVAVKWRWHLSVDSAEHTWLHSHLAACGWPTVARPSRPKTGGSGGGGGSASSGVRIATVYFDSPGPDTGSNASRNGEWVRLANTTKHAKTITGWRLLDASGHSYDVPTFRLGAGRTVKIHTGSGTDTSANLYWGSSGYIWNNTGDTAVLRDASGSKVDSCTYTSSDDPKITC